jgi:Family of unknown function (DUF5675)
MNLALLRDVFTEKSTTGLLSIDQVFFAYSLELPVKDGLPGSAIPQGRYQVTTYASPHFGRLMPLILVPGRSEIEMHWGDYPKDTRGCILLGHTRAPDFIGQSREAFNDFWFQAQGPMEQGECFLTITEATLRGAVSNAEAVRDAVNGEN